MQQAAAAAFHKQQHIGNRYVVVPHMDWGIQVEREDLMQCAIDMVKKPVRSIIEPRQRILQTTIINMIKAADE
jgi:hypothetical protein